MEHPTAKKTTMNTNGFSASPGHGTGDTSISRHRKKAASVKSQGFCRRFSDCIVMGPAQPQNMNMDRSAIKLSKLARQVEEIDKELNKEKEMNGMYKMKLEKTQVLLKYCLQVAQDHGFLDAIVSKDKEQHLPLSPAIAYSSIGSSSPCPSQCHPDLVSVMRQAKTGGWYIEPDEIEMLHLWDQGSTADIYKGKWRGVDVAVKCMYSDFLRSNENGMSFFAQEVETLSRQRHPFVLQLMGTCLAPPHNCWIVTEFLNTNLKEWLHGPGPRMKDRTIPLPPLNDRTEKALEIAQAMQYLHESKPRILHRDLKPSNIFLDDALHVRVADFGHARYLYDEEKALTGETGTFVYMAPEVIRCCPYDEKCDVYSFGVILNELLTGEYPYIDSEYGPSKIAMEVAENGFRPTIIANQDEAIIELIKQSWDQEPEARPNFAEITSALRIIQKR
ncbi:serine/threonine-protein kinase STY46-like [Andrographis paniculata]|uniref:serine/threonine-protein kinase STY46-like n=1 Tax=Andrographis paniculata TaxID=175694 RepID=UPI0021E8A0ED|nr:serine/threonine-protein kinase STY46-like [Andrographis paniculata]